FFGIDHEQDRVGLVHGDLDVFADGPGEALVRAGGEPGRVDDRELTPVPLHVAVQAIARRTGNTLGDGHGGADQAVEQRGLAHVGPAHDGDNGLAHAASTSPSSVMRLTVAIGRYAAFWSSSSVISSRVSVPPWSN